MQKTSPLVKEIGQLINARFHTFEVNIDAKMKDSENRVTKNLEGKIKESGDEITKNLEAKMKDSENRVTENLKAEIRATETRVTKNLRGEIKASEERVTKNLTEKIAKVAKKLDSVEEKLVNGLSSHQERIKRLERQAAISA